MPQKRGPRTNLRLTSDFLIKVNFKVNISQKVTIKVKLLQNSLKLINSISFNSLVKALVTGNQS